MRRIATLFFFLMLFASLSLQAKLEPIQTPPEMLFGPVSEISELPIVKKIPHLTQSRVIERAKIEYLIARVRKSHFLFVRNGEMHPGQRAALHLMNKYRKRIENIKTVEQFITDVASGSALTGEPYYLKYDDGKAYRVRDVFFNELRALDLYLAKQQQS